MTTGANRGKTTSEAELRRLWLDKSVTLAEIGRRLGITQQAVTGRAERRGLPPRPMGPLPAISDDDLFRAMWSAGVTINDMAAHFGVNEKSIRNHVQRLGLPKRGCYGWSSITMAEFQVQTTLQAMKASAAQTRAALIDAEMLDRRGRNGGYLG